MKGTVRSLDDTSYSALLRLILLLRRAGDGSFPRGTPTLVLLPWWRQRPVGSVGFGTITATFATC